MFTTIAAALASGAAGILLGVSLPRLRGRGRDLTLLSPQQQSELVVTLAQHFPTRPEVQAVLQQVNPSTLAEYFPMRGEIQEAFQQLALIEQQRVQAAKAAPPQPSRPAAVSVGQDVAVIAQQLASLNQRMQQLGVQRNGSALGGPQAVASANGVQG